MDIWARISKLDTHNLKYADSSWIQSGIGVSHSQLPISFYMHNLEIHTRLYLILKNVVHMFYESVSSHYTCLLSVFSRKLAESNKRGSED